MELVKTRIRKFYKGWRKDAARHFKITENAVGIRFNRNDTELINWIEKEWEIKKTEMLEAKQKKDKMLAEFEEVKKEVSQ